MMLQLTGRVCLHLQESLLSRNDLEKKRLGFSLFEHPAALSLCVTLPKVLK